MVGTIGDPPSHCEFDIGGLHLASFVLITTCNPFGYCDIDFGGPNLAFLMLTIVMTILVVILVLIIIFLFPCHVKPISNPLGHHDLSGLCLTSFVFVTALIFLVVILIFVVLVVVNNNAHGYGLGCNYW